MEIMSRVSAIVKANVGYVLDQAEDPAKMIDQYFSDMLNNLAEIRNNTAEVIAQKNLIKSRLDEIKNLIAKYDGLIKKAILAGNDDDAMVFIGKKQELESSYSILEKSYESACENTDKMRALHDSLVSKIGEMKARRDSVHIKMSVAESCKIVNKISSVQDKTSGVISEFERMEKKAEHLLEKENAVSELLHLESGSAQNLVEKYESGDSKIGIELEKIKKELGM